MFAFRISSTRASSTSSVSSNAETHYVNIASLPDHKNSDFLSWLHARLFGLGTDSDEPVEQIKYVFWCLVVQYSNQDSLLPCCVVLTERRVFILQLRGKDSSIQGVPALETFYILPLCNIQQVLTGLCYSYIRLEESFVGSSGTFALIATESDIGKEFFEVLKSCVGSNPENGELDVINGIQDCDLSKQIFECEEVNGECTGRVALAAYVTETETGSKAFLVLSENHVYIFKSCVLFWPKPTFDLNKIETERRFEIAQQFNVEAKISEINKYKVSSATAAKENEKSQAGNQVTTAIRYQEFGLSMVFHESLGSHGFDFQFLSSKVRDSFLDQLTSLRSEHAHRMSPTLRQEPEGGNESSDGSEDKNVPKDEDSRDEGINQMSDVDCDGSDSDTVEDTISVESFGKRKLRSKTEVIITRKSVPMPEEDLPLPSYTLHYLTPELISHLESNMKRYTLFQPLSAKLQSIREMNGQTLAEFFHKNIVPVGHDNVELHDIVWTNVIPYTNPKDEVVTCVMLSNRAVYFVSDRPVRLHQATGRPSWMTHARHVSDSIIGLQSKEADRHHSSGILHLSQSTEPIIKPYCVLDFADIKQINVGLFDQCVRLTGDKRETVFTLVTRNSEITSMFMKNLSTMLSLYIASPMLESSSSDLEQDFYKAFNKRTKTTVEGIEYIHPSRVKFCYPGDEAISDLLFLINEHLKTASFKVGRENILQYIAGFKTQSYNKGINSVLLEPISIILTNECLCLVTEDLVSYPLPDFVRGLPSMPRQHVTDVKKIEYLKHLKLNNTEPRDITLVFSDEKEDIVLVPDHYSLKDTRSRDTAPEIPVRLLVQSEREMNKFIMLIKSQWKDLHPNRDGELLVF